MIQRLLILVLAALSLCVAPAWSQVTLGTPRNLSVTTDGAFFRGRWDSVEGASYYEVWTNLYGNNWKHNEKDHNLSPFTSSFELPGGMEGARFRVRAVSADGKKGKFSDESEATLVSETPPDRPTATTTGGARGAEPAFDPAAPPPPAPSSLFAVWTDPREIHLVWQAVETATRYTVEELVETKWISVNGVEYPKETTAVIKNRPMPGPYQFRIRAIGRNGRASDPSRTTTARR